MTSRADTLDPSGDAAHLRPGLGSAVVPTILVVGSLFLSQIVYGVYEGLRLPLPPAFPGLTEMCVSMSVLVWFRVYSEHKDIPWVLDMGWFLLNAWVIILPYYLWKAERKHALGRMGLFCLTYLGAWATGTAIKIWLLVATGT
jgi:hypothetical protein